jgi:hypothetical protein
MPDITTRRKARLPKPAPKLGDIRTRPQGDQTYVGEDHELAPPRSGGWVLTRRLDAYNRMGGRAVCDDSPGNGPELTWPDIRVIEDGRLACHFHGRIRSFAWYLVDARMMTPTLSRELDSLMRQPCRKAT